MYREYATTITLCIGDWPVIHDVDVTLCLEWDARSGDIEILGVTCDTLPNVTIENPGIVRMPHGQFLKSPLAESIWAAARSYFSANEHDIIHDLASDDAMEMC